MLTSSFTASPGIASGPGALFAGMLRTSLSSLLTVTGVCGSSGGHSLRYPGLCVGNRPSTMASIQLGKCITGMSRLVPNLDKTNLYGLPHRSSSTSAHNSFYAASFAFLMAFMSRIFARFQVTSLTSWALTFFFFN